MADLSTLLQLRNDAKDFADMKNRTFVTDPEWNMYINHAIKDFYNQITTVENEYYIKSFDTTTSGSEISLPSDFWKLRGVDIKYNGVTQDLKKFNFANRNLYQNVGVYSSGYYNNFRYRLLGSKLVIKPIPPNGIPLTMWYYPVLSELVNDGDTFDFINGADDLISMSAAIRAMMKEETDSRELQKLYAEAKDSVFSMANRDENEPEKVTDVTKEFGFYRHGYYGDY